MRIALFTETFLPKVDGIVNTLCHLLDHLAKRRHTSLLFAPAGGPPFHAQTPVVGMAGRPFPLYGELKLVSPFVDLRAEIDRFQPDLIHLVNPVSLGLAGLRHARRRDVPLVASYHTDVPGFAARWGWAVLREPLWAYFRWIHNQARLNLCPSRVTQAELQQRRFKRVKVWGRGVDTDRFSPQHYSWPWRVRLTLGRPDAPLLLYVGRLSPEKRIDWLRLVLDSIPHARLAIVGDGPARPALEQRFAGTPAVFTGRLVGADLAAAYASADLFTFPSANETLGNVILEAMASGLPVIAPRAGGLLDHVVNGETGLLTEPESHPDFIAAIQRLVIDPALARRMGSEGRERTLPHRWASVLDRLLDDYASVIRVHHDTRRLRSRLSSSARFGGDAFRNRVGAFFEE